MILAMGKFSTRSVLNAALAMSEGITANHNSPIRCHPNGWGAVWRSPQAPHGLFCHRDTFSFKVSFETSPLHKIKTDFLAVHVRHATLAHNQGLSCTHPISREGMSPPWYLLHNGFLPTVYQKLGRERSIFDSREYFDYIVPDKGEQTIDPIKTIEKLENLPSGGSSANAILVNPYRAYVIHWTPKDTQYRDYFTMHRLITESATFIASDIIPALAPPECWSALKWGEVLELKLGVNSV